MPTFKITVLNEEFTSQNELECADQEAARKHGIGAALAMGAEQVAAGKPFFGAQVLIHLDGAALAQFVVSVGATPIKVTG